MAMSRQQRFDKLCKHIANAKAFLEPLKHEVTYWLNQKGDFGTMNTQTRIANEMLIRLDNLHKAIEDFQREDDEFPYFKV